uniref:Penicillin-binding protein 1A n=1 Tax=Ammonifex degensii TaxID=42838 RepID=A0A7C2ICW5_9THEO
MKIKDRKRFNLRLTVLLFGGGLFLFILAATGWLTYTVLRDLPPWQPGNLQIDTPSTLCAADGTPFATLGTRNYLPVAQEELTSTVKQAFIAAEDRRFYRHWGFDIVGILRAVWSNFLHGRIVQGGSTITQQLAKNAFLGPSRTLKRKVQEVFLAVQLERHYTKDEILTFYLNRVYFGEGAWGIGAAARTYFNKRVSDLTLGEAALLAGLVQVPSYYDPFRNPEAAVARRNTVLKQMLACRFITPEQYRQAEEEPLHLHRGATPQKEYLYPDFTDYVITTLERKYGQSYLLGGLKIYTTLDTRLQQIAEEEFRKRENFPSSARDANGLLQPQAAVVFLDPFSGAVRALVGGREHLVRRQFNRAVQARRQPGSAFKPIIAYGPAVEFLGMRPQTTVRDEPVRFGSFVPRNYDGRYRGTITLQDALAHSVNVAAVKLLNQVGLKRAAAFARRLGIEIDPARDGLSAALGGLHSGVTPLEMAAAYAAFANGGEYIEPVVITRVVQPDGTVVEEAAPVRYRAMRRQTADAIAAMLRAAVRYGTGTEARIGTLVAGKTGTTDEGKDLWFCGWVPKLVGVVWMGWDQPRPMPRAYGGKYCARLWRKIVRRALGIKETPVPPVPESTVSRTHKEESVPSVYGSTYGEEATPEKGEETPVPGKTPGFDEHLLPEQQPPANQPSPGEPSPEAPPERQAPVSPLPEGPPPAVSPSP